MITGIALTIPLALGALMPKSVFNYIAAIVLQINVTSQYFLQMSLASFVIFLVSVGYHQREVHPYNIWKDGISIYET